MPPMTNSPCRHCGHVGSIVVPGVGPHGAAERCANPSCDRLIRWVPKAETPSAARLAEAERGRQAAKDAEQFPLFRRNS